jgi:maleate isomerase
MLAYMTGQFDAKASVSPDAQASREYGRAGLFGILTPQGNPTVEPEMRVLLPASCATLVSRLTSRRGSLRERLIEYSDRLENYIADFDGVRFDAVAFACTGSSYLATAEAERRRIAALEDAGGYPVVTAAAAIEAALRVLNAASLALISPYPSWLTEASRAHWERVGFRISALLQLPSGGGDAHGIYGLTSDTILSLAAGFDPGGADAVLVTGTGMPSLRTIVALEPKLGLPVLSSNLCLAWALMDKLGAAAAGPESRLFGGWAGRLASA